AMPRMSVSVVTGDGIKPASGKSFRMIKGGKKQCQRNILTGSNNSHGNLCTVRPLEGNLVASAQAHVAHPEAILARLDIKVRPWNTIDVNDISPVAYNCSAYELYFEVFCNQTYCPSL